MNSKSIFTVVFKMSPHHILRLLADFSRELCPVCILTKRARAFVGFFLSKDCNLSMLRNRSRLLRRCEPLQLPWCGASSVHSVSAGMRNNPKKKSLCVSQTFVIDVTNAAQLRKSKAA